MQEQTMIRVRGVKKRYRLGQIGGGTLRGDVQSWWARVRGREDPNVPVGTDQRLLGTTFMALNGIDLEVKKGEAVGIIGSNGAGKSTLLKLLTHVTAPTEGEIDLYGRVASMLEVGTGFHPEMTGRENVYLNGAILGMTRAEIDAKMEQIIDFSEVREFIDTPVKRYSSGMYVKLAFSVAAHLDSEIMIMDEVLAVGDVKFQQKCLKKMRQAAKQDGRTVLYVSHNMATIRQLCDRCVVLDKGKIVYEGDVEKAIEVYSGHSGSGHAALYDLEKAPRPSDDHGFKLHITDFAFLGKEAAVYDRQEPLTFQLGFRAGQSIEGIKLYFVVESAQSLPVGLAQTYESFVDAVQGQSYRFTFRLDISQLAPGRYTIHPDLFSDDGEGHHLSYDHPLTDIEFEVVDAQPRGLVWNANYYGSVVMAPIRLLPTTGEVRL